MATMGLTLMSVGLQRPRCRHLPPGPAARATALGSCSILLWALWPALAVAAKGVLPLQLLAVAFACAFAMFVGLRLRRRQPAFALLPASSVLLGAGLLG